MQKNLKPVEFVSIVTFLVFFVASGISFSKEYLCSCDKYYRVTVKLEGSEMDRQEENICPDFKYALEYEEGFLAISAADGSKYTPFDVTQETKAFVKAEKYRNKDNFTKLNFNKNSKTLRYNNEFKIENEAVWSGNVRLEPYSFFKTVANISLSCKKK